MHGRGIAATSNARFVGAYDVDRKRAEAITARFGGCVFDSLQQLLPDPGVDAVHVLTPVQHHMPHAIESLFDGR
jgi:predicted dehydrogenase